MGSDLIFEIPCLFKQDDPLVKENIEFLNNKFSERFTGQANILFDKEVYMQLQREAWQRFSNELEKLDDVVFCVRLQRYIRDRYANYRILYYLARKISLQERPFIIMGAGFSFKNAPYTPELERLARTVINLLCKNSCTEEKNDCPKNKYSVDSECWNIIRECEYTQNKFKELFKKQISATTVPKSHKIFAKILLSRVLSNSTLLIDNILCLNWDDFIEKSLNLCIRKMALDSEKKDIIKESLKKNLPVLRREDETPLEDGIWKCHGDINFIEGMWELPGGGGYICEKLKKRFSGELIYRQLLILGYGGGDKNINKLIDEWKKYSSEDPICIDFFPPFKSVVNYVELSENFNFENAVGALSHMVDHMLESN